MCADGNRLLFVVLEYLATARAGLGVGAVQHLEP